MYRRCHVVAIPITVACTPTIEHTSCNTFSFHGIMFLTAKSILKLLRHINPLHLNKQKLPDPVTSLTAQCCPKAKKPVSCLDPYTFSTFSFLYCCRFLSALTNCLLRSPNQFKKCLKFRRITIIPFFGNLLVVCVLRLSHFR